MNYLTPIPLGKPPATEDPPKGHVFLYFDKDGILHIKRSDGTVVAPVTNETLEHLDFSTNPSALSYLAGRLKWNSEFNTLELDTGDDNVTLQIGQENHVPVVNNTGSTIPDGSPVYISGTSDGMPEVSLAQANSIATSKVVGITTHDILDGEMGKVTTFGLIHEIDTSQFNVGDILWLDEDEAGKLTSIAPVLEVFLGYVVESGTSGTILMTDPKLLSRDNGVLIRSKNDLPDPSGGKIQLKDFTNYFFIETVDIGTDTLVCGTHSHIAGGSPFQDTLKYTGTGYAVECVDQHTTLKNITLEAPNGTIFLFKDSSGNEKTHRPSVENCIIKNTNNIGDVENVKIFGFFNNAVEDTSNRGLVFTGSSNGDLLAFDNLVVNPTGTVFDLGSSVWDIIHIDRSGLHAPTGSTILDGLDNSGNLSSTPGTGRITNNNFIDEGGTLLVDVSKDDLKWEFLANGGVDNSEATAVMKLSENTTATTIDTAGVFVKVAGTTIASNLERFTMPQNNRLKYIGIRAIRKKVTVSGNFVGGAGTPDNFTLTLFKNGSKVTDLQINVSAGNVARPFSLNDIIQFSTDDYIELFVRNNSDTTNPVVENVQISIR